MMSNQLTTLESKRLASCERVIQADIASFQRVGLALAEIKESKLYRETHGDFQTYCKERWGFDRSYAHRLIDGSKVAQNVANCQQKPANEAQTRELGKLPEEKQAEAWDTVIERTDGKPTAAAVAEVVEEYTEPEPSHGFTASDTRDAYKDCKEAAKLEIESPSKANLKAYTESIFEMIAVTESRTVLNAKMNNLISSIGR
jgi:hypothetical protein